MTERWIYAFVTYLNVPYTGYVKINSKTNKDFRKE